MSQQATGRATTCVSIQYDRSLSDCWRTALCKKLADWWLQQASTLTSVSLGQVRDASIARECCDGSSVHVEIDPDVHPVVRDGRIHPRVVRAQELQDHNNKELLAGWWRRRGTEMRWNQILHADPYPDLEPQELHVVDCLLKHGADIHLGPVGHQTLQDLQPLVDPFPPLLHTETKQQQQFMSGSVTKRSDRYIIIIILSTEQYDDHME